MGCAYSIPTAQFLRCWGFKERKKSDKPFQKDFVAYEWQQGLVSMPFHSCPEILWSVVGQTYAQELVLGLDQTCFTRQEMMLCGQEMPAQRLELKWWAIPTRRLQPMYMGSIAVGLKLDTVKGQTGDCQIVTQVTVGLDVGEHGRRTHLGLNKARCS